MSILTAAQPIDPKDLRPLLHGDVDRLRDELVCSSAVGCGTGAAARAGGADKSWCDCG